MNEIKSEISLRLNFVPPRMKKKHLNLLLILASNRSQNFSLKLNRFLFLQ